MTNPAAVFPSDFRDRLESHGLHRAAFYGSGGGLVPSHPGLADLAEWLAGDARDFHEHEGIFLEVGRETRALFGAFVHRTCRGQGAGGVRLWNYDSMDGFLRDGLRLSRGMTHKNALAGLWWGGGKGVIARDTVEGELTPERRRTLYEEYGTFMTSLKGCYVTAEDVGTSVADMAAIFARTRFTTCIPEHLGGSGNPSVPTARGVVRGMEAALAHLEMGSLEGKSVAVQGLGHVGEPLVRFLVEKKVGRLVGADIDPEAPARIRKIAPGAEIRVVERGDLSILGEKVDILAPCATGAILGPATIPNIRARIVCGAANNQLEDPLRDDRLLDDAGILYLPDFLVNRMGIVTCADEAAGYVTPDPLIENHLDDTSDNGIYRLSLRILEQAKESDRTPAAIALELAEERSRELNPIFGHRSKAIIDGLAKEKWA